MLRTFARRLAAAALTLVPAVLPSAVQAQKALVYCPVGIDAAGCDVVVAAISSDAARFPGGADAGYDGTQGSVDLATSDFAAYAVFVVPSLADGPDAQPYALLRNPTIAGRLQAAFVGRVAVWSGTPDVGSTNRSSKDALIRNLAWWASADPAGSHGPGVVALQDNSDDEAGRYGWLGSISTLSVRADTTFDVYSNVQVLTSTGQVILTSGGMQLGYTNIASFGLVAGPGGRNDATGDRTNRVVLVTAAGEAGDPGIATVSTDKDDYAPGDTVTVTGTGWEPGEPVSLLFHEDANPPIHPDKTLNTIADELGHIFNREYDIDSTDIGVRFTLTATGRTSGRTAQATFTDNKVLTVAFAGGGLGTVTGGDPTGINCPTDCTESVDNNANISLHATPAAGSTLGTWSVVGGATSVTCPTGNANCTFNMNNKAIDVTVSFNAPDLTIAKTHTGTFTVGTPTNYTISVKNSGSSPTSGLVTMTDVQPAGLTFTGASGTGWSCSGTTTIQCTRSDALAAGASYPNITLSVTPSAAGMVTNTASVAGGGESNTGNDSSSDPVTVLGVVDLTVTKSHTGNFTMGVNGVYTLAVSNAGGAPTAGTVTLADVLPAGLGFVSATGSNWNCGFATGTVTCARTNVINAGNSAPAITLTVSVAAAAVPSVTNTASVSGGGEPAANNGNNSDSDPTTVIAANGPPVVDAGGPYTGNEGAAISLNTATATDPDAGDTPTYQWTYVANGTVDAGTTCSFGNDAIVQPSFTCTDDGAFTVTLTVNDGHGHIVSDNAGVSVANVKPVATAGGPYSGAEGAAIQLAGVGNDPGDNDDDPKLTYKWTVTTTGIDAGGACSFDDDTEKNARVTCTDDGAFKVKFVATDDDGGVSDESVADLTVANVDPVADAGGPYDGNEGQAVQLHGSVADAGSNDTHVWSWQYVAGTGVDAGATCSFDDPSATEPKITCTDDGEVKLTLKVTDDDGGVGTDETTLTLVNVDPVAHAGGPYTGDEGSPVQLNGSATDAGSNDTHTWSWQYVPGQNVDPGATCQFDDITSMNPKITCTDDGTVELTLTVKDDDGGTGTDEATLTLSNVAPTAIVNGPYWGTEGSAVALNGSQTDPGANDTFSYLWAVNTSGIDAGGACTFDDATKKDAKLTCTDDGAFTLTLTVTDDDGGQDSKQAALTVQNANPVAVAGGPYAGAEGGAIQLSGSATDAGSNDPVTYLWTANTAGIDAGGACTFDDATKKNARVTCTDDGSFTLTLTASDDDGGAGTSSATLTVQNANPVIAGLTRPDGTALPMTIAVAGTLPFSVPFSDAGLNDTHTAQIDCGLGTYSAPAAVTPNFQTSCTFTTVGLKTINVKVTDDDGGSAVATQAITVKYVFDGFYAPVDRPNTMNVSKAGQAIPLKWRLTDANGAPITDLVAVTIRAKDQSCSLGSTADQIEEYAAGESGLKNLGNGNYQFNWKTPSTYAGSCKSVELVFGAGALSYVDGPYAFFTFKK